MPENEQQEEPLTDLVVREAVGIGMETSLRDPILEAVEDADGRSADSSRSLPLAGGLFGLGTAVGYLVGRQSGAFEAPSLEESSIDALRGPEVVEDAVEEVAEPEPEPEPSSRRLPWLVIAVGALVAVAVLRRRRSGESADAWEPVEEFEPATDADDEEDADEEGDGASEDEETAAADEE